MEQYLIKFSSDSVTVDGKDVSEVVKKETEKAFEISSKSGGKETMEEISKIVKDRHRSKREIEKEILHAMLQTSFKDATKPQDFRLIADIDLTVSEAKESFLINIEEWKKYIVDNFEKTMKRLSEPVRLRDGSTIDAFPYYWKYCLEMMEQFYAPQLNKIEPVK